MIAYEDLRSLNLPFVKAFRERFDAFLNSGWYILGEQVKTFEQNFSAWNGSKHCVGVANGLDALILSLRALDFKAGSEVIVPSNTYIATILSILQAGLKPVLVEPDIRSYNIDPDKIEEAISSRTCAVMIVHLYGKCCEMDGIVRICQERNLRLIEDCAQSHGARYRGKCSGTFGDFGAFSFYPTKNLGALGDAGALLCEDDRLAQAIRRLRNYGSDVKYYNEVAGYNSRLDEIQAGFLSVKLEFLAQINAHKRSLARLYLDHLRGDYIKPIETEDCHDVFHIFNVRHPRRDELKKYLLENDIKTEIHYPVPPHKQKAMRGVLDHIHYPIAEEIHQTTLSLPCSFCHTTEDIYRVIEVMNKF